MDSIIKYTYQELRIIRNVFDDPKEREKAVRNLIVFIGEKYSKQRNYRVVCFILDKVSKNGAKIDEAIKILDYWNLT